MKFLNKTNLHRYITDWGQNFMRKKRQYHIWQYKLDDICENHGKLMVNFSEEEAINTSESLLLYILNKKIREHQYDDAVEYKTDENGNEIRVKKNIAPIITVETGRSRNKEQTDKLRRLLPEGVYINTEPLGHFAFLESIEYIIKNSSKYGDIVVDTFLGSGTTLIAADNTDRIYYGSELDLKYAQVIVERWINYKDGINGDNVIVERDGK